MVGMIWLWECGHRNGCEEMASWVSEYRETV